ncbi:MAG: acetyl-CoA carboxylase carboxyltransferase subunit alpha [Pseudomonadota bacterium]|nr:acetyl-CoA carboxylase carboxyltransferase subunit alpha [Pseudomonadota bacterium]
MDRRYLSFEQPIGELEEQINELRRVNSDKDLNFDEDIKRLETKSSKLTETIFSALTPWQITQLARHPGRPFTLDYIPTLLDNFVELHGDRMFGDDHAIVAGLGNIDGRRIAVIGHQKGRDVKEKVSRNFGMPKPEGYRKAQRVMRIAERFGLPLLTLIDTPGAYPGVDAEERGQSEAIASSLSIMTGLKVPIVSVIIGEGGSGGALAIGICDRLLMLEYSTYSVISPEGCASILWKSADKAEEAAQALKLTSKDLTEKAVVDEIIMEPHGGAHRNPNEMAVTLRAVVIRHFDELDARPIEHILDTRYRRLMSYGQFKQGS